MGSRGQRSASGKAKTHETLKWSGIYKANLGNGDVLEVPVSQLIESAITTGEGKMNGYGLGKREQRVKRIENNFKKSPARMQLLLKHAVKNSNFTKLVDSEGAHTVADALERLYK